MNKKLLSKLLIVLTILLTTEVSAQINAPRPSPTANIKQVVGITDLEINYSRPGVKGRTIFGELVPFGKVWRTGANRSTKIKFSDDITIGGKKVTAGEYAIYSIPTAEEWTIIIYSDLKLGGNVGAYKQEDDVVRFTAKTRALKDHVESFTIDFNNFKDNGATLTMSWENTAVDIPVEVDTDTKMMAMIKAQLIDSKEEATAGTYHAAAVFYQKKKMDMNQALIWMNKSVEMSPNAFWYMHRKAKLLADMGKTKEAKETAKKSMEMAKNNEDGDFGYIKRNEELLTELEGK